MKEEERRRRRKKKQRLLKEKKRRLLSGWMCCVVSDRQNIWRVDLEFDGCERHGARGSKSFVR